MRNALEYKEWEIRMDIHKVSAMIQGNHEPVISTDLLHTMEYFKILLHIIWTSKTEIIKQGNKENYI